MWFSVISLLLTELAVRLCLPHSFTPFSLLFYFTLSSNLTFQTLCQVHAHCLGRFNAPCSWRSCSLRLCRDSWQQLYRLCGWSRSAGQPGSAAWSPEGGTLRCSALSVCLKLACVWGSSGPRGCTLKHTRDKQSHLEVHLLPVLELWVTSHDLYQQIKANTVK